MRLAELEDENWLPPANVILEDAVVYIVTKITDKSTRAERWKTNFDTQGEIRVG
jgi:hypothetical protein